MLDEELVVSELELLLLLLLVVLDEVVVEDVVVVCGEKTPAAAAPPTTITTITTITMPIVAIRFIIYTRSKKTTFATLRHMIHTSAA